VLVFVTAIKSDSECIQLEMVTVFLAQNFSRYLDVLTNRFTLHSCRRFTGCQRILWSDQLPDTMAMQMGCVLLPIIIVVKCQYSPGQLCDSGNDYSFDISHNYFCNLHTVKVMDTGGRQQTTALETV